MHWTQWEGPHARAPSLGLKSRAAAVSLTPSSFHTGTPCSLQISFWPWAFWHKACRWPGTPGFPGDSSSGSLPSGELAVWDHLVGQGQRMGTLCVLSTD